MQRTWISEDKLLKEGQKGRKKDISERLFFKTCDLWSGAFKEWRGAFRVTAINSRCGDKLAVQWRSDVEDPAANEVV